MKFRVDEAAGTLSATTGGGCGPLVFGGLFGGLPLVMMIAFLAGAPIKDGEGDPASPWMVLPFLSVFVVVGLLVAGTRRFRVLDRERRELVEGWGLFRWRLTGGAMPYEEPREVALDVETRRSKNSTYEVYPVRLHAGAAEFEFGDPLDQGEARRGAEALAGFLGLPLVDRSGGTELRREPELLDETVAARLRRLRREGEEPIPDIPDPDDPRLVLNETRYGFAAALPRANLLRAVGGFVPALLFAGFGYFVMLRPMLAEGENGEGPPALLIAFLVGFFCLPIALVFLFAVLPALMPVRLVIDRRGLRYQQGFGGTRIPLFELEVCELGEKGIALASDRRSCRVGKGLKRETLAYLHMRLLQAIDEIGDA